MSYGPEQKRLPLLDAFRTLNWTSIKDELQFSNIINWKQLAPNLA